MVRSRKGLLYHIHHTFELRKHAAGIAASHSLLFQGELPFSNLDYLFLPAIKKAVEEKDDEIKARRFLLIISSAALRTAAKR